MDEATTLLLGFVIVWCFFTTNRPVVFGIVKEFADGYPAYVALSHPKHVRHFIDHFNLVFAKANFDSTHSQHEFSSEKISSTPHKPHVVPTADTASVKSGYQRHLHINKNHIQSLSLKSNPLQHTIGHGSEGVPCPACEQARVAVVLGQIGPEQTFGEASEIWFQSRNFTGSRGRYVAPRTLQSYEEYLRALNRFFSSMQLSRIHVGHIRGYQMERVSGKLGTPKEELFARVCKWMKISPEQAKANPMLAAVVEARASKICKEEISPNKVNQEIGVLCRILKRAGCWSAELEEYYEPLQREESGIPKALTPAEQAKWLEVAQSNPRWHIIYWYSLLAFRSTASNVELRGLRLGDISLPSAAITIRPEHAKNKYRIRTITVAPDAVWAIERLKERAYELGSCQPHHALFPFRDHRGEWIPEKCMTVSGLKKLWDEVQEATGLKQFTPHDCRHTAITRYAEAGTPMPVIMAKAGHISRKMFSHYTQISEQAQRWADDAVYNQKFYPTQSQKKMARGAFGA